MNFEKTARCAGDFHVECVQYIHDLKGSLALGQETRRFDADFSNIRRSLQELQIFPFDKQNVFDVLEWLAAMWSHISGASG